MRGAIHTIGISATVATAALIVVGIVSGEIARHVLQTMPLWPAAVLGLMGSPKVRWTSAPFLIWILVMLLIWAYLFHLSNIAAGTYSPIEIAMTVVVVLASMAGIGASAAVQTDSRLSRFSVIGAFSVFLLFLAQIAFLMASLRPPFENDRMFLDWIMG